MSLTVTAGRYGSQRDFSAERLLSKHYKDPLRHLDNEKRDKNILLHQFLQEQDYILRERGLIGGGLPPPQPQLPPTAEPRDFSSKPSVSAVTSSVAATTTAAAFHRPFEQEKERVPLTNGYEYAEYERRLLAEREHMLGQSAKGTVRTDRHNSATVQAATESARAIDKHPGGGGGSRSAPHEGILARLADRCPNELVTAAPPPPPPLLMPKVEPSVAVATATQPVVSSLDSAERVIREARLSGTYASDDDDDDTAAEATIAQDEEHRQRLLLIASGPPIPVDRSPPKLRYLQQFELTTHDQRKGQYRSDPQRK